MKYLSNLNGLEFGGTTHDHGDEIKVGKDEQGAMDILVTRGDVTAVADDAPAVTSNGDSSEPAPADPLDHDGDGRKGGSKPRK